MSDFLDTMKPSPATLTRESGALMRESQALGARADAGIEKLGAERTAEMERRKGERGADSQEYNRRIGDLQTATLAPPHTDMPSADLGPPLDPEKTQQLAFGLFAMSLVGAAAGRKHWGEATAALDGLLQGFRAGSEEQIKEHKAKFEREFRLAKEKQAEAVSVYQGILKSKELSLNQQAELIRVHSAANQDWEMNQHARERDFEKMYTRMDHMRTAADRLQQQAVTLQDRIDARAEKRADKAEAAAQKAKAGTTLSEKYRTDPDYKRRVDSWAKMVANGTPLPARFGQGVGKEFFADVMYMAPSFGSPEEMRAGVVELAGQKSEARALGTRTAAIEQAASEAREMSQIVRATSAKFPRTDFAPVNQALAAFDKRAGRTEVRQFGASINSYINAYARAVNPSGVATVADKEHAREMLSTADSPEQVTAILDILDQEMTAAQHSPRNVKKQLRSEITGGADATVNWSDLK